MKLQPRLIRLRDAPAYLGINKNTFNRVVRPTLSEVSLGKQTLHISILWNIMEYPDTLYYSLFIGFNISQPRLQC